MTETVVRLLLLGALVFVLWLGLMTLAVLSALADAHESTTCKETDDVA